MPQHDFRELYDEYPQIIEMMPPTFTSHQFIQRLAQENQRLYIEALYAYRDRPHRGEDAPFQKVHNILAQHLTALKDLVVQDGEEPSADIFGGQNMTARWRKLR